MGNENYTAAGKGMANDAMPESSSSPRPLAGVVPDSNAVVEKYDAPKPSDYVSDVPGTNLSLNAVAKVLTWHPFIHLFVTYAKIQYPRAYTEIDKVGLATRRHPRFFKFCRYADFIYTTVICLLSAMLIGVLLLKIWHGVVKL